MKHAPLLILLTLIASVGQARNRENLKSLRARYENKFLVVLNDGMDLSGYPVACPTCLLPDNSNVMPVSLHKGELLQVRVVRFPKRGVVELWGVTLSRHQMTRGVGAYEHESPDFLMVIFDDHCSPDLPEACQAVIEKSFKIFDTQKEAANFGNTASGVFVKEVKLGMSYAEVESVLGPPSTRVDLGKKVLYKYRDMTVEFHDGRVTDVR